MIPSQVSHLTGVNLTPPHPTLLHRRRCPPNPGARRLASQGGALKVCMSVCTLSFFPLSESQQGDRHGNNAELLFDFGHGRKLGDLRTCPGVCSRLGDFFSSPFPFLQTSVKQGHVVNRGGCLGQISCKYNTLNLGMSQLFAVKIHSPRHRSGELNCSA